MNEYNDIINEIHQVVEREAEWLLSLSEEAVTTPRNSQGRTVKMLVGHLIDSASNNHQRIVRLQYAPRCGHSMPGTEMGMLTFPDYTQDNDLWIALQDYQHEPWPLLVSLFRLYNLHIAHIIGCVDRTKAQNYWLDYEGHRVTLHQMICGYCDHLRLHTGQMHELVEK
ncbi:MAG: DinB family protein [Bacteroidales bacterium]|nr:DinB family protein [Bacteroidales bacterium]